MKCSQTLTTLLLASSIHAHSWVEQLNIIAANGTMIGNAGYPRGNVLRTDPAFSDTQMTWLLPPNGRTSANPNAILPTDHMCKTSQTIGNQTTESPALIASPGDMVALRYQENGHVTLPATQIGKPANRGTVYVYGTTKPSDSDTLLSIHKVWNAAGTGGNGAGILLATRNYDDGQCYQANSGTLSIQRQAQFSHVATEPMGVNIWCQSDITIPVNAPTSGLYTVYWVWDWPTAVGTEGYPLGKNETYTTCMDISMTAKKVSSNEKASFKTGQDLNLAAVQDQLSHAFLVDTPGVAGATSSSSHAKSSQVKSKTSSSATSLSTKSTEIPALFHETAILTTILPSTTTSQRQTGIQQTVPGIPTYVSFVSSSIKTSIPQTIKTVTRSSPAITVYETATVYTYPESTGSSTSEISSSTKVTSTSTLKVPSSTSTHINPLSAFASAIRAFPHSTFPTSVPTTLTQSTFATPLPTGILTDPTPLVSVKPFMVSSVMPGETLSLGVLKRQAKVTLRGRVFGV